MVNMAIRSYLTHDNGDRRFLVKIDSANKTASIYKKDKKDIEQLNKEWKEKGITIQKPKFFSKFVKTYKYQQVFIGRDGLKKPAYPGNSILLRIGNLRYVYIGEEVREFSTDERITKYHSPVGNSDVPYPTADGPTKTYFMLDMKYVPNDKIKKIERKDAYQYYYGHKGDEPLEKYARRMKKIKVIEKWYR
tara:strand:+ start:22599 stop:23171 length:573 start_codon:yes stop_codon:yes gene_type:complete